MKYNKTPSHGVPYWFDAGTGAETTGLTNNLTGTVTKAANRSVVTGTGTSFTTELAVGALFVVGTEAAIVSVIDSDTTLYLDTPSSTAYSGSNFKTNNYHFDYTNDAIIARVYKTSAGFHLQSLIGLDSTLTPQQAITRTIYRKNSNVIDDDVGTFSDPLDGNSGWSLGIPALTADGDVIYASTRTLTSDGNPPQDSTWSTPVVYAKNGLDAYTIVLTNESHVLPTTSTGTVTYTDSGTTISVFKGATELNSVASNPTAGQFSVTTSATNITPGTITVNNNPAVVADHSSITATSATVDYTINLEDTVTAIRTQNLVKATDGSTGLRTVHGNLYYEKTDAGAPSAPTGTTYTFSTGKVSGTDINDAGTTNVWKNEPNTQDATETNTYYILTYFGTEASAGSSTLTVTYGTVKTHTDFTGVVTFTGTGNEMSDGTTTATFIEGSEVNSNVTSISGGVIQAGSTVEVGATGNNRAGLTGTAADGSGSGQADEDIRIYSGSTFANRANAPFSVTQEGEINAEFGTIGGFSVGIDSLISNSEKPLITLGSNLSGNPDKQITLSARDEDDFLLYAGIAVPSDGSGVKAVDNPPFSVDSDGKVTMRSFELRDSGNIKIMDSTNLLSDVLISQIGASLGGGTVSVAFDQTAPNTQFELQISQAQNVEIDFEIYAGGPVVSGVSTNQTDALNSIMPSVGVEIEYRVKGTSTWNPFGTVSFTGVQSAGSQPSLSATQYWINGGSYMSRTQVTYYSAYAESGYGCLTSQGNFKGSIQQQNLAANTYEVRINALTNSDKNITVGARSHNPSGSSVADYGYGYGGSQSTTGAAVITNTRNFTVKSFAGGGYLKGDKWNADTKVSPIVVKDSVTFDDFLPLEGDSTADVRVNTLDFGDSSPTLSDNANYLRIQTSYGYTDIGSANSSYSHFYTDRGKFYFNKQIDVDSGIVNAYNDDLQLRRANSTTNRLTIYDGYSEFSNKLHLATGSANGGVVFVNSTGSNMQLMSSGGTGNTSIAIKTGDTQSTATEEFRFTQDGDFHADGNITAYSSTTNSDIRLKDNIENIEKPLEKLEAIRGVTWNWKRDGKAGAGVVAQEVEKVFPQAVSESIHLNSNETHKTVDYNQIIGILIESVKEQQIIINNLEKRLAGLESDDV
jgi:hypothetical protein